MCLGKPKIAQPQPIIERQALKTPVDPASLTASDPTGARRRLIAGIVTSAQGVPGAASTTRKTKFGGDQNLNPIIGAGGSSSAGAPAAGGSSSVVPAPGQYSPSMILGNPDILRRLNDFRPGVGAGFFL